MAVLSAKDKIRLKQSAKRAEDWHKKRIVWANQTDEEKNPRLKDGTLKRCHLLASGEAPRKPEVIRPDKLDAIYRESDGCALRSSADKLTRQRKRQGEIRQTQREYVCGKGWIVQTQAIAHHEYVYAKDSDGKVNLVPAPLPSQNPAWKDGQRGEAKPASPFKKRLYSRAKSAAAVVVKK